MSATMEDLKPPALDVEPAENAPVRRISSAELQQLSGQLTSLFQQYVSDRRIAELKWLRNLRQYRGEYDPDIEKDLSPNRSRAYPRITRVKCISVLSRLMNLMFPGNERPWSLEASPSADMDPADVQEAVQAFVAKQAEAGVQPEITPKLIQTAVQRLAEERAADLALEIDDQLEELGGDQTLDFIQLCRKVVQSGVRYGMGVIGGPFVRSSAHTSWEADPATGGYAPRVTERFKPQYDFLPIWDFYPDFGAKQIYKGDGYFIRLVMARSQVRALANREDFFGDIIRSYLSRTPTGNYKPQPFETELRGMGVKANVNEMKQETSKYEIICWHGPVSGQMLSLAGAKVPQDKMADDIEAEVWMIDGNVIKADINPWRKLGLEVRQIHCFLFDEDDSSPISDGLADVMRDSQMSIAAAARMLLDNASVVCGPNLEVNTDLARPDQDLTSVQAYKIWYREGQGAEASYPAVRNVQIDAHLDDLMKIIDLFMRFADAETFVGPATGGDMPGKGMSEPMRTAAGASMLRGDAALPFKDIVRNFDAFLQSVIYSLVQFNKKFNPGKVKAGDFNVVARGATSLIAKEVRGMQVDQLAATLTPPEMDHIDERKLVEARLKVRDLGNLLVPPDEAKRRQDARGQQQQQQMQQQAELTAAQVRKALADSFKAITQGQKNSAAADAQTVKSVLELLEQGLDDDTGQAGRGTAPAQGAA